jgi:hypothetical protein
VVKFKVGNHYFDGKTYCAIRDKARLNAELEAVIKVVLDGAWYTLAEISSETGYPEASVSARLRDLRKKRFGAHTVQAEYVTKGLWRYKFQPNL